MPPNDTPNQRLASQLLGEPVRDWVRARRPVPRTWRQIAAELRDATNGMVDVAPATLLNWFPELTVAGQADSEQPAAQAS